MHAFSSCLLMTSQCSPSVCSYDITELQPYSALVTSQSCTLAVFLWHHKAALSQCSYDIPKLHSHSVLMTSQSFTLTVLLWHHKVALSQCSYENVTDMLTRPLLKHGVICTGWNTQVLRDREGKPVWMETCPSLPIKACKPIWQRHIYVYKRANGKKHSIWRIDGKSRLFEIAMHFQIKSVSFPIQ